jgi:hypothetical protein
MVIAELGPEVVVNSLLEGAVDVMIVCDKLGFHTADRLNGLEKVGGIPASIPARQKM